MSKQSLTQRMEERLAQLGGGPVLAEDRYRQLNDPSVSQV